MLIESLQNEKIKNLIRLTTDNRYRKKSGTFIVEGKQENERAAKFGFELQDYFICESIYDEDFPKGKIHL
ncbi:MAG: TrmH family RNA methyltransferase, partial [Kaistella sp.]